MLILLILIAAVCGYLFLRHTNSTVQPPKGENPNFLTQVDDCFIPTAALYGYTLRITAAFRSMADQAAMYDQGRTVDGHIVSEAPPGHSLHNYGYAVDVVDRYKGYNIDWTQLVEIGGFCGLESGGVGDLPHFEERGGLTTDQFAAGMRPPALTLPCPTMLNDHTATSSSLTIEDITACATRDSKDKDQTDTITTDVASTTIIMAAQNYSEQNGVAIITSSNKNSKDGTSHVVVNIAGEPITADEPMSIYTGSCDLLGGTAYPLNDLIHGMSTTAIDVSLSELLGQQLPLTINVEKAAESSTSISCGDIDIRP